MNQPGPAHALLATRAEVRAVTVYHLATTVTTRTTVLPTKLETFPGVEVHHVTDPKGIDDIYAHVADAHPAAGAQFAEYRWKLVFSDATEHRVGELYVSAIAPVGMLGDERALRFSSDALPQWLMHEFAPDEAAFLSKMRASAAP